DAGKEFDDGGKLARNGNINEELLQKLNALDYYKQPSPKSLANEFGVELVYPLIRDEGCEIRDALRTYVEHIVIQICDAVRNVRRSMLNDQCSMLVTGGGAFNSFLIERLREQLKTSNVDVVIPDEHLVAFKEA